MLQEIIGYRPVVSNNEYLLGKFYSGTLRIMDTMRQMSLFASLLEQLLEFILNTKSVFESSVRNRSKKINQCPGWRHF